MPIIIVSDEIARLKNVPTDVAGIATVAFIAGELRSMKDMGEGKPAKYQPIIESDAAKCRIEFKNENGWRFKRKDKSWSRRDKNAFRVALAIYREHL
jgi:hypothetical protein